MLLFLSPRMNSDIESEPPPEPAPPEHFPPSHRDISMASINAITVKPPSNFVLKIDNGDLIHEEFVPQSQHGKFFCECFSREMPPWGTFVRGKTLGVFVMMQQAVTSNNHCHIKMRWIGRSFAMNLRWPPHEVCSCAECVGICLIIFLALNEPVRFGLPCPPTPFPAFLLLLGSHYVVNVPIVL